MIPTIRLHSQQLINPVFNNPKDLVSWMGGIQAQDYTMSKWAIGIRLKAGNLQTVNEALAKGDILRIHVMRPTWHYVAAEDIRWMLKLSSRRIITPMTLLPSPEDKTFQLTFTTKQTDYWKRH